VEIAFPMKGMHSRVFYEAVASILKRQDNPCELLRSAFSASRMHLATSKGGLHPLVYIPGNDEFVGEVIPGRAQGVLQCCHYQAVLQNSG